MTRAQRRRAAHLCDVVASNPRGGTGGDEYAETAAAIGLSAADASRAARAWIVVQHLVGTGREADLEAAALLRSGWEPGDELVLLHVGAMRDCLACKNPN